MGIDENILKGQLAEDAVNKLAFDTYLKYWCYPNPKDELGDKKEICDLLIIFKDVLLLIAVKNYSFDGNYEKYFKSTLDKAKAQIQGAERKLFKFNRDIYFKHPDKPIEKLEINNIKNIYRIIVNINNSPLFYPGGLTTNTNQFVHVFNWDAFLKLVIELDTIPDFIQYLNVRNNCFGDKNFIIMTGEENDYDTSTNLEFLKYVSMFNPMEKTAIRISGNELDLVGDYLFNERKFNKNFYSTEYNMASFELDGKWERYLNRKEVQRKKQDDKVSYFVDEFVKREVLYKADAFNIELAIELLSLNRFERRVLSKHFFDFCEKYKTKEGYFIARRYGQLKDIVIGFFLYGVKMEHEHVMTAMELAMEGYCVWENYKTRKIIMIGLSNELHGFRFGYMKDIEPFSKEIEEEIVYNLKVFNWFQNIENVVFNIKEYPD